MADELTSNALSVDQALHGYSDGHRLLAGTAKLSAADARTMLILSDASGPGVEQAVDGYLTGYPLHGCRKYVLARTWAAPEMSRPGCVWTHSLLIDFADLATMASADGLLSLYRRPVGDRQVYEHRLRVPSASRRAIKNSERAGGLLNALYLHPLKKVEMRPVELLDDEHLVLSAWFQQWPRLRRAFRFCMLAGADRSLSGEVFDLQVTPVQPRTQRHSIHGAIFVEEAPVQHELDAALVDLVAPEIDGLGAFLRKVGGDVSTGRVAMTSLCRLYSALNAQRLNSAAFSEALDAIEKLGPGQGHAARGVLFNRALENVDELDARSFRFVVDFVGQDFNPDRSVMTKVGIAIWRRTPRDFASALESSGPIADVARIAIETIDSSTLVQGIASDPSVGQRIALKRPDLLLLPAFWAVPDLYAPSILEIVDVESSAIPSVLTSTISAGRSDTAEVAIARFGVPAVVEAICATKQAESTAHVIAWIVAVSRHPERLAQVLSTGGLPRNVVAEFSRHMDPDDLPNDFGEDPWAIASDAEGLTEPANEDRFAAFLLARALGYRSRSCAKLFAASFARVHNALATGILPEEAWRQIERRLSWSWFDWDRCRRVREAVVNKFIDLELDTFFFERLTNDQSLYSSLVDFAASRVRGRRYLKRVHRSD